MTSPTVVDLARAAGAGPTGTLWTLPATGDLGASLVALDPGGSIAAHVNREADLLLVGVAGRGTVTLEGEGHELAPGVAVHVPKGVTRAVAAGAERVAFLTVHRRTAVSRGWLRRRRWPKMERAGELDGLDGLDDDRP